LHSYSQWGQDVWVARFFNGKQNGFFLEIGAGNGLWISNTLLLQNEFGWNGILVEPTIAFDELIKNRPNCICDNSCISSENKPVTLVEIFDRGQAEINKLAAENTLLSVVRDDIEIKEGESLNSYWGVFKRAYKKECIRLEEVLRKYDAPNIIDYFSLDVEGYEYEILKYFNFNEYSFLCISIERPSKELQTLLENKGYHFRAQLGEDSMYTKIPQDS
jgi:hypothetical protein